MEDPEGTSRIEDPEATPSQTQEERPRGEEPGARVPSPPSPGAVNGEGAPPPKRLLDELNKAAQRASQEADKKQEKSQALKTDVAALTTADAEVSRTVEAYGKARPGLEQQRAEREDYIENKRDLILNAIGDRKDEVDNAWDEVRADIDALKVQLEERKTALEQRKRAYQDQQIAADEAQMDFDRAKNRLALLNGWLTQLTQLRTGIEAAEDASDEVGMYVRLLEYDRLVKREIPANLQPVDAYRRALQDAWRSLKQEKDALRDAATARTQAQNELEQTQAELDRLQPNRVDEVLTRVPEDPSTGAVGSGV